LAQAGVYAYKVEEFQTVGTSSKCRSKGCFSSFLNLTFWLQNCKTKQLSRHTRTRLSVDLTLNTCLNMLNQWRRKS